LDGIVKAIASGRGFPSLAYMICSTANVTILIEISVDQIEEEICRVRLWWDCVTNLGEVCGRF
jgi:hypothetical protein